ERDRHDGALPLDKQKIIWTGMAEMIEAFAERTDADGKLQNDQDKGNSVNTDEMRERIQTARANMPTHRVLCLPARDNADELAASMLAQILTRAHHTVRVVSVETLAAEMVGQVKEFEPDTVCISALPPLATTHARY